MGGAIRVVEFTRCRVADIVQTRKTCHFEKLEYAATQISHNANPDMNLETTTHCLVCVCLERVIEWVCTVVFSHYRGFDFPVSGSGQPENHTTWIFHGIKDSNCYRWLYQLHNNSIEYLFKTRILFYYSNKWQGGNTHVIVLMKSYSALSAMLTKWASDSIQAGFTSANCFLVVDTK